MTSQTDIDAEVAEGQHVLEELHAAGLSDAEIAELWAYTQGLDLADLPHGCAEDVG